MKRRLDGGPAFGWARSASGPSPARRRPRPRPGPRPPAEPRLEGPAAQLSAWLDLDAEARVEALIDLSGPTRVEAHPGAGPGPVAGPRSPAAPGTSWTCCCRPTGPACWPARWSSPAAGAGRSRQQAAASWTGRRRWTRSSWSRCRPRRRRPNFDIDPEEDVEDWDTGEDIAPIVPLPPLGPQAAEARVLAPLRPDIAAVLDRFSIFVEQEGRTGGGGRHPARDALSPAQQDASSAPEDPPRADVVRPAARRGARFLARRPPRAAD